MVWIKILVRNKFTGYTSSDWTDDISKQKNEQKKMAEAIYYFSPSSAKEK